MTTPATPSKLTIIFAGEDFTAELLDASVVPVRVRALPVRHLMRIVQLAEHEAQLLEYLCLIPRVAEPVEGEPSEEISGWTRVLPGWADNLTEKSHNQLYVQRSA